MNRLRAVALVCAFVVPTAVVCDDLVRFALSLDAHRCCASTGGECARLSTPDECCQTREQAIAQGFDSVAPDARAWFANELAPVLPVALSQANDIAALLFAETGTTHPFKRPHDPPHLHPFPLLI